LEWGLAAPSKLLHQLQLSWDALNAGWNDWMLGYGPDKQHDFMRMLGMDDPSWRKMMLTLITLVIGLVLLVSAGLALRYRPPARDRAAILYQRFVSKTGFDIGIGETPDAFALRAGQGSRLDISTINDITDTYLEARYGITDAAALQHLEDRGSAMR